MGILPSSARSRGAIVARPRWQHKPPRSHLLWSRFHSILFLDHATRPLGLRETLTDLRRARRYTDRLYVFSLEGCVRGGFLRALCEADLAAPARADTRASLARAGRAALRGLLRAEPAFDALAALRGHRP